MKIFTQTQIKELDQYTIANEPVKSIDLMERAAKAVALAIAEEWSTDTPIVVFAGPGNNGGDALAVARILAAKSYAVSAYLFNVEGRLSEDCDKNAHRAVDCGYLKQYVEVKKNFDPPILDSDTLIVDGLFGIGLDRPLTGGFASLVQYINQSGAHVVSIDIPSGLMPDSNEGNIRANIVKANVTYTFQQKKLAFFMADNQPYLGKLRILDIGLSKAYMQKADADYRVVEKDDLKKLLRPRSDFANKGTMGHALIIAGSYGMAGAAILATRACLRAGVGKVTVQTPQRNYAIMQIVVPEAIVEIDHDEFHYSDVVTGNHYDAIGMGPGLGQSEDTAIAMIAQIRRASVPVVLDADALNILANHGTWMQQLPKNMILTPHPGELDRLCGHGTGPETAVVRHSERPLLRPLPSQRQSDIQLHGQLGHGHRRQRRRAHRHDNRLAGPRLQCNGVVSAWHVPARARRRSGRRAEGAREPHSQRHHRPFARSLQGDGINSILLSRRKGIKNQPISSKSLKSADFYGARRSP